MVFIKSSIVTKLTLTVIIYFLILFTIFTGYTAYQSWKTSSAAMEENMQKTTQYTAAQIEKTFQQAFDMLETEAAALATHYKNGTLTDEYIINLKRELLNEYDNYLGNSSIFEPGIVSVTTPELEKLVDETNRFIPYVVREENGNITEVAIEGYIDQSWYVEPVVNGKSVITEPYDYEVNGQTLSMVTLSKPVLVDGKPIGYVSTDFTLEFLTKLVNESAPDKGVLRVITSNNTITADSLSGETIGKAIDTVISGLSNSNKQNDSVQSSYVTDKGLSEEVLQISAPISFPKIESKWFITSAVPTSVLNAPIKDSIIEIIIGAIIIAVILASLIWYSVKRNLKPLQPLQAALEQAATGDLTASIDSSKLKNDEIGLVGKAYNFMIEQIRLAVDGVVKSSNDIQIQTTNVSQSLDTMHRGLEDSNVALEEVAIGSQHQADEMENAVNATAALATNIDGIHSTSISMKNQVQETLLEASSSIDQVNELKQQQLETNVVNDKLSVEMDQLLLYVNNITQVMDTIRGISEQTNLLALNASIEAARAGEHGQGFAVVAQEVRKLAEQSHTETISIQTTIDDIRNASSRTAQFIKESSQLLEQQSAIIGQTENAFTKQVSRSEQLADSIASLAEKLQQMIAQKDSMLENMHTIAAISEENAASTEELSSTTHSQLDETNVVRNNIQELEDISNTLNDLMKQFKTT